MNARLCFNLSFVNREDTFSSSLFVFSLYLNAFMLPTTASVRLEKLRLVCNPFSVCKDFKWTNVVHLVVSERHAAVSS